MAECKNITVQLNAAGSVTIGAADVDNGSSDNRGEAVALSLDTDTFDCSKVGDNTVTLTATDGNSNTNGCTATVSVQDGTAPTARCKSAMLQLGVGGSATLTTTDMDDGSSDNCGIASLNLSQTSFTATNLVTENTVTLTATDGSGNTNSCTTTVSVLPVGSNMPPVAVIDADPTSGNVPLEVTFSAANSTDNIGIVSYLWDFGDGSTSTDMEAGHTFSNAGSYDVTLTVEDAAGLTNTATVTIAVEVASEKMTAMLVLNPSQEGVARVQILNQPGDDAEIFEVQLYDIGGKLVSSYLVKDLQMDQGAYVIPVDIHRNGLYLLKLIMSEGEPFTLKLMIRN